MNRSAHKQTGPADPRGLLRGALTVLLVVSMLAPLESIDVQQGKGLLLVVFWLLLLLAWCLVQRRHPQPVRLCRVDIAILILVLSQFASCLWMSSSGNARASWNVSWQWLGLAASYFVSRQLLDRGAHGRAVVVVMITLAMALSAQSFYESFHIIPQRYHRYFDSDESGRRQMLEEAGIVAPPGSPLRYHFESRLRSSEPAATFSLANSYAGFLTPWLLVALGVLFARFQAANSVLPPGDWLRRARDALPEWSVCLLLGFSLLLTKSRSSWVAVMTVGAMALLFRGRRVGGRRSWQLAGIVVLVGVLMGLLAFMTKRLDTMVFSQTFESLSYRFEYWFSSLGILAENPIWGSGPGHFQDYYTQHMLPTAHEVVADPHNWVLEIAATSGLVGIAATGWLLSCLVRHLRSQADVPPKQGDARRAAKSIQAGALAGLLLALPYSVLVDSPLDATLVVIVGLFLVVVVTARCRNWIEQGELSRWVPLAALVGLSVHLLAAGGLTAPGVSQSGWLLLALCVSTGEPGRTVGPQHMLLWMLALLGLVALLLILGYQPMTASRAKMMDAQAFLIQNRSAQAIRTLEEACQADPLWPQPALELALARHTQWGESSEPAEDRVRFQQAAHWVSQRDSRSASSQALLGTCYLVAYQRDGHLADAEEAKRHLQQAHHLFPTDTRILAQLAWACWLLDDKTAARHRAAQAWELDQKYRVNKFIELQLDKRKLIEMPFPGWSVRSPRVGSQVFSDLNQLVDFLRNPPSR